MRSCTYRHRARRHISKLFHTHTRAKTGTHRTEHRERYRRKPRRKRSKHGGTRGKAGPQATTRAGARQKLTIINHRPNRATNPHSISLTATSGGHPLRACLGHRNHGSVSPRHHNGRPLEKPVLSSHSLPPSAPSSLLMRAHGTVVGPNECAKEVIAPAAERGHGRRCVLVPKALTISAMLGRLGNLRLTGDRMGGVSVT